MGWRTGQHRCPQAQEGNIRRAVFPATRVTLGPLPLPLRRDGHRRPGRGDTPAELATECLRQLIQAVDPVTLFTHRFCSLLCGLHILVPGSYRENPVCARPAALLKVT